MSVDMQRYVLQIICAIPFGVFLGVLAILFEVLPIANHKRYKIESIEQKVYAHFHLSCESYLLPYIIFLVFKKYFRSLYFASQYAMLFYHKSMIKST